MFCKVNVIKILVVARKYVSLKSSLINSDDPISDLISTRNRLDIRPDIRYPTMYQMRYALAKNVFIGNQVFGLVHPDIR